MLDECPELALQLWYDMVRWQVPDQPKRPSWKRPGESAAQARDRLRAERRRAKALAA